MAGRQEAGGVEESRRVLAAFVPRDGGLRGDLFGRVRCACEAGGECESEDLTNKKHVSVQRDSNRSYVFLGSTGFYSVGPREQ